MKNRAVAAVVGIAVLVVLWVTRPPADQPLPVPADEPVTSADTSRSTVKASLTPKEGRRVQRTTVPPLMTTTTPKVASGEETAALRGRLDRWFNDFIAAWTLRASVEERRAALEPFAASWVLDGLAVTHPDDLPSGQLYMAPLYDPPTLSEDYALATLHFVGGAHVDVEVSRIDGTWRVLNVYPAG